jgi:hypothetical protein
MNSQSSRIVMISTHDNVAGEPEHGRPDTGGQVVYVLELSKCLADAPSMLARGVLERLRDRLRQPPKQRSSVSQRYSKVCGELSAPDGPQKQRNWLFEANFPWMLL